MISGSYKAGATTRATVIHALHASPHRAVCNVRIVRIFEEPFDPLSDSSCGCCLMALRTIERAIWAPEEIDTLRARFESHIYPEPNTGCYLWGGSTYNGGHGFMGMPPGESRCAHRIAWRLAGRELPRDAFLLHKCNTPACVAVDHLYIGTAAENARDMSLAGRGRKGRAGLPCGVHRKGARFEAAIGAKKQYVYLGIFDTAEEAANAVNAAKRDIYGATR